MFTMMCPDYIIVSTYCLQKMRSISLFLFRGEFVIGMVIALSVIAQVHSEGGWRISPVVLVRRRQIQDLYTTLQQNTTEDFTCHVGNATLLVTENQCVSNFHLFNGNLVDHDDIIIIIV